MFLTDKQRKILTIVLGCLLIILIMLFCIKSCTKNYKITFDSAGGTYVSALDIKKNNTISKPKDPQKDGYIFEGWYYNDELFDFNTKVTKDMVLKAKWTKVEIKSISLNAQSLTLKPDGIAELEVIFNPANASSELNWESSDESIVTVNKFGKVTALKEGEATITVTTEDGKYKDTCKIKVEKDVVSVTSVTINGKKEVTVGDTIKLTVNIKPKDASNKDVKWTSSDKSIATVDSKGNVKGIKKGKVKINVKTIDGEKEDTIEIEVKEENTTTNSSTSPEPTKPSSGEENKPTVNVTGVSLSGANSVNVNSSIQLNVKIDPENAANQKYTCTGDNPNVATVSANCKVTGRDDGEVTVTVTTEDGKHTATHKVTVKSVYSITFKRIRNDNKDITGYNVIVYKNGQSWKDYKSIYYNGNYETYDNNTALKPDVDEKVSTATIYLKNGNSVQVSISYID